MQCCEHITQLDANFARCFSTLLREGRGQKHEIAQIAVFPVIFVADCRSIVVYFILFKVLYFRSLILIFLIYFTKSGLNVSSICFRYHENLTSKQTKNNNHNLQSFLELILNLKRKAYIQYVSTSKNSLNQLFRQISLFSMSKKPFLTCTLLVVCRVFLTSLIYDDPISIATLPFSNFVQPTCSFCCLLSLD